VTAATQASLHELPAWVDVTAMAVAALFSAHTAQQRRIPIVAVLFLGLVGGLVGGMLRDMLLGLEPSAISTWYYVPVVVAAAIIGGLTVRRLRLTPLPFVAVQAVAVALLITIGVQKALAYHTPGPSAILVGVIAATAGSAAEDVLTQTRPAISGEGPWMLGVVVVGATVFWFVSIYVAFYLAVIVTVLLVAIVRVSSVHFGWTTPYLPGRAT